MSWKKHLESRRDIIKKELAEKWRPIQDELEEIEKLLSGIEETNSQPSCWPHCGGCDKCRRGERYR